MLLKNKYIISSETYFNKGDYSYMKELFDLFWTFCKIGALTFGGGYAMLPLIQREIVENKKWRYRMNKPSVPSILQYEYILQYLVDNNHN